MNSGLIHIYCGDGKGKTTAAMGLGMRAAGRNMKVLLTQFLKDNTSGEINSIEKLKDNFSIVKGEPVVKFVWNMNEKEKEEIKVEHMNRFSDIIKKSIEEQYDLLILDEIIASINIGFIDLKSVIDFLKNKPKCLEVVMTGRDPKEELLELANYVSEVKCIKHPFNQGIPSRIGIEK